MKITYDPEVDVMYVYLSGGHSAAAGGYSQALEAENDPNREVRADYDGSGQLIGLEILGASERFGGGVTTVQLELLRGEPARSR